MKTEIFIAPFLLSSLAALADGPVTQVSPFMQPDLQAQNPTAAQSALGFTTKTTLATITNIANVVMAPAFQSFSNNIVAIQVTSQAPWDWETNGWIFDWWKPTQPASGTAVTSYMGRYGNVLGGNGTYDPSVIGGTPGLTFPAGNGLYNPTLLGNNFTNCGTIAVIFSWTTPANIPVSQNILSASGNGGNLQYYLTPTPVNPSGNIYFEDASYVNPTTYGGNMTLDSPPFNNVHVFVATWKNGVYQDFMDGKMLNNWPVPAAWHGAFATPVGFDGGFYLGNSPSFNATFQGGVGEVLISQNYATFLIEDEISTLFLRDVGRIRKTVEIDSDSITGANFSSFGGDLDTYLDPLLPGWSIVNCGIGGESTGGMMTNQMYETGSASSAKPWVNVFYSNLNNDGEGGASQVGEFLLNITNNLMRMATSSLAQGHTPLLVVPTSNPYTDTNGERALFINWATNCALNYFSPPLIRLDLTPPGTNGAWQNTSFFPVTGDAHGTNLFYSIIAPSIAAAINQSLAGTNVTGSVNIRGSLGVNGT